MSDDCAGNPKWLAVSQTIKDRYLNNLSDYPRLNENEQNMMGDLHKLIDELASLKLQIERMGRCVELIGIELSENGCDCKDDPPKNDCLACLIQKHLVALREIDGGGPEPGHEAPRVHGADADKCWCHAKEQS